MKTLKKGRRKKDPQINGKNNLGNKTEKNASEKISPNLFFCLIEKLIDFRGKLVKSIFGWTLIFLPLTIFSCQSPNFALPIVFLASIKFILLAIFCLFSYFFLTYILFWLTLRHHSLNICHFLSLSIFLLSHYFFCQLHNFSATPTFIPASYHIILPLSYFAQHLLFPANCYIFEFHLSHIAVLLTFTSISNILLSISRFLYTSSVFCDLPKFPVVSRHFAN